MHEYKGYVIVGDGQFGMKTVKQKGSGALPKSLRGWFTNTENAMRQIDIYLTTKEVTDGKESRTN